MILIEHIAEFLQESYSGSLLLFSVILLLGLYPLQKLEALITLKIKKPKLVFASLLFAISISVRIFLFIKAPTTTISADYSQALSTHFWEYFWNDSYKPPLNTIIFAILNIFTTKNYILATLLLDVLAIHLLFLSAYRITKKSALSFGVLCLYSLTILPFEFWRDGIYWDHFSTIFIAVLIYWVARLSKDQSNKTLFMTSLAGGVLIAQSTVNVAIAPVFFLIILCIIFLPSKNFRRLFKSYLILISIPAFVTLFCLTKNYLSFGIFSTSILGGEGLILTTTRMFDEKVHPDYEMYKEEILKTNPPKWWMWCWEWGSSHYKDSNAATYYGNTGYCYRFVDRPSHCTPASSKTIDFTPILNYLKKNGPEEILKVVQQSQYETCYKPWLHAPTNIEFRHKFRGPHSKATIAVAKGIIKNNPHAYIKSTLKLHKVHGVLGPRLQRIWVDRPNIGPWSIIHHLGKYLQSKTYKKLLKLHEYVISLAYLASWTTLLLFLISMTYLFLRKRAWHILDTISLHYKDLLLVIPPVFGNAFVFTMAVGGENFRYFFQSTPYLIVFFIILISQFQDYLASRLKIK